MDIELGPGVGDIEAADAANGFDGPGAALNGFALADVALAVKPLCGVPAFMTSSSSSSKLAVVALDADGIGGACCTRAFALTRAKAALSPVAARSKSSNRSTPCTKSSCSANALMSNSSSSVFEINSSNRGFIARH